MIVLSYVSGLTLEGSKVNIAFCNVLAVNTHPLEDFSIGDICFVMKITSYRSTCTAGRTRPLNSHPIICSISTSPHEFSFFVKVLFRVKTGEVEVISY